MKFYSLVLAIFLSLLTFHFSFTPALAIVDPFDSTNNHFGIHLISATPDEASPAAQLVNSSGGDWGYVTVLIKSSDRSEDKWQTIFNDFRRRHLIPIVRLTSQPEGAFWKRPYEGEEVAWADFLDKLVWPVKNRYVTIYNEPNQGQEWGGSVDAGDYATTLDKTITALKNKNTDFFVLNAGLDASAPEKAPLFQDEASFLKQMNSAVPGIFEKLDGWVSHSYPNPGFIGSPTATGRGTVTTWEWELNQLKSLGANKNLPVFITETGWKHAEGKIDNYNYPSAEKVAGFYKYSFDNTWNNPKIVAITPFLLTYQDEPFDHFSFKKYTGEPQDDKILGISYPDYYPQFETLFKLNKKAGLPVQDQKAELSKGGIFSSLVTSEDYFIPLTFKNTGQSIWSERDQISLQATINPVAQGIEPVVLPKEIKIEPGGEYTFVLHLKGPPLGKYTVSMNLFAGNKQFDQPPILSELEAKDPVTLKIKSALKWKKNPAGEYILRIVTSVGTNIQKVVLGQNGESKEEQVRYLLPDYSFDFILERPYYKSKVIKKTVVTGENILDFGILEPDYAAAMLHPDELWRILPWGQ